MGMQYDVKSTHLNASGSVYAGRARIKGFSICATASSAGTLLLKDGGSSGTTKFTINTLAGGETFNVLIPAEGVLCRTSVYATLTNAKVTVFYA